MEVRIQKCLRKGFHIIKIYHYYSNRFHTFFHLNIQFSFTHSGLSQNTLTTFRLTPIHVTFRYTLSSTLLNEELFVLMYISYYIDNPLNVIWIIKIITPFINFTIIMLHSVIQDVRVHHYPATDRIPHGLCVLLR